MLLLSTQCHSLCCVLCAVSSSSPSKSDALKLLRTFLAPTLQEDVEFLLEYHLVECQELENVVAQIAKKLQSAEEAVRDPPHLPCPQFPALPSNLTLMCASHFP